jgi:hypothetical protein
MTTTGSAARHARSDPPRTGVESPGARGSQQVASLAQPGVRGRDAGRPVVGPTTVQVCHPEQFGDVARALACAVAICASTARRAWAGGRSG